MELSLARDLYSKYRLRVESVEKNHGRNGMNEASQRKIRSKKSDHSDRSVHTKDKVDRMIHFIPSKFFLRNHTETDKLSNLLAVLA